MRSADGRFLPGISGNPSGRPKVAAELRELAAEYTEDAVLTILSVMRNKKVSPAARLTAAGMILDRAWGKPHQTVDSNTHVSGNLSHEQWIDKLDAEDAEFRARAAKLFNGAVQP